ncbi:MAG: histidine decarboxylase [Candidatus Kaiserbacteria bacterium]|nr:histidine decarboxylase [Candidatus Kaiserbacteria bacterium]
MRTWTVTKRLAAKKREMKRLVRSFLGYPSNAQFEYSALFDFLRYPINNVGDPYDDSSYLLGTREFEQEVLAFFAQLYKIPESNFWGYVTNGGTEGNMHGLFLARELYPDSVLYFSADSHYSITKIARVLRMEAVVVPATSEGTMDLQQLAVLLRDRQGRTPIFSLNIGTTMKGGIDSIDAVLAVLHTHGVRDYYIHCDAALYGMLLPFLEGAPVVDFTKPIDSVAISGHKFIGSPVPCGVSLTKKEYVERITRPIEYIETLDTTISGSRNAFSPMVLWYAIQKRGYDGFKKEANTCIAHARYLHDRLVGIGYSACLNDFSNTVLFEKPPAAIRERWQLATQNDRSHVVVMQHVTKKVIDRFVRDLQKCVR